MPRQKFHDLLTPENLNSVAGLSLIARMLVEGGQPGMHSSPRVGQGMEFSQYRGYEPGDDLRLLDWKMLARSGRYYIKQADVDSQVSVRFILDSSKSMEYKESTYSKLEYARILIASLAYLAKKQGDALGLYALNDMRLYELPTQSNRQQFNRLLLELIKVKASGTWPKDSRLYSRIQNSAKRELIFFISDLYENEDELTDFIKNLKTARNEVVVLHLMEEQELNFNHKGTFTFEDLETGSRIKINTQNARADYLERLEKRMKTIKNFCTNHQVSYELVDLSAPISQWISLYFKKRNRLL